MNLGPAFWFGFVWFVQLALPNMFEAQMKRVVMSGHKRTQIFIRLDSKCKVADQCVSTDLIEVELC